VSGVREVDVADEVLLRRLWELGANAAEEVPHVHDFPSWPSWRWQWTNRTTSYAWILLAAYDGDEPVGYAEVGLPLLDNTGLAEVDLWVAGPARGRGHGGALLDAVVDRVRRTGRKVIFTGLTAALEGVPTGQLFAENRGFVLAQCDVEKTLDPAAHRSGWRGLLAEVESRSDGYEIATWVGQTPAAYVDALCALRSGFNGEIPLGGLELEDEAWDAERLRTQEREFAETGRIPCITVALGPAGDPAGYTEIVVDDGWPGIAFQEATLVLPVHRGRRLGLRLKLVNQLRMTAEFPEVHTIETGNAGENDHMNAVNEVLGFRPAARWLELQRRL